MEKINRLENATADFFERGTRRHSFKRRHIFFEPMKQEKHGNIFIGQAGDETLVGASLFRIYGDGTNGCPTGEHDTHCWK